LLANMLLLAFSVALALGLGEWLARYVGEDMTPPGKHTAWIALRASAARC
jgi:hypothetical protein